MTNELPLQEWLKVIREEYLDGFVKEGGSSIKFAVPVQEDLGPLLEDAFKSMASDLGYMVVGVDAGETRVHMHQDIFFRIASQVDWRLLTRRVILRLSADAGYLTGGIDPNSERPILQSISDANSAKEDMIAFELRPVLIKLKEEMSNAVLGSRNMSRDFRSAMTELCLKEVGGAGQNLEADPLIEWLTGRNQRVSNVRAYSIFNSIVRTNARHFLESLLYWVRFAGYPGTVILLNNSRVTLRARPKDGLKFYTRSMVMDHYELLRELIDDTDRLEGLFMVVLANRDFLNDDSKGYSIYQALKGRIADEVHDRSQANPMSALVSLADKANRSN